MPPGFELYKLEILCPNCCQRLELCGAVHGNLPHFAGADVVFSGTAETQRLPLDGKVPNAVRRMRWSAHHRCGILSAATSSRRTTVHRAKATLLSLPCPHCKPEMPPHQSLSRQLPLEGKPNSRQKAPSPQERKSLPLEGKVPNAVRRMRWGAHHCCNFISAHHSAKRKGKTAFAAITPLHAKDATSSVGFRRQLPLEGKPSPTAKSTPAASKKPASFPLSKEKPAG